MKVRLTASEPLWTGSLPVPADLWSHPQVAACNMHRAAISPGRLRNWHANLPSEPDDLHRKLNGENQAAQKPSGK
jgi:hypothetical protein